jgi:hypothetical protein
MTEEVINIVGNVLVFKTDINEKQNTIHDDVYKTAEDYRYVLGSDLADALNS